MKSKFFIGLIFLFAACESDIITPEQQLKRDIATIDGYLASKGITNAIKDASGIRIVIHTLGTLGLSPNAYNTVKVNYTGSLLPSEQEFETGTVSGVFTGWIKGWQIALAMLPEGTEATLYIPSTWAYGPQGSNTIPGNANLIFDIEVVSVTPTASQTSKLASDITAIDQYIASNAITDVIAHDSGIRYVVTQEGTGDMPTLYDQVKFTLRGKVLSTGIDFTNGTLTAMPSATFSSRVANYLHGIMIGLQLMKVGQKTTFYVPSGLAYGPQSYSNLPANSNVIFEIELLEIID